MLLLDSELGWVGWYGGALDAPRVLPSSIYKIMFFSRHKIHENTIILVGRGIPL